MIMNTNDNRILGYKLSRELSIEELKKVSGGLLAATQTTIKTGTDPGGVSHDSVDGDK
ncbi:bacteriocin-type signal sequence-containing protein [Pseudoxanthomonas sp. GM95]|nr:bacteriocin-type signal sequence-containing protein [Pseudoxanthomonas sp. GM95]